MKVLVTGAAGFIGSRIAEMLLYRGVEVVAIDTLNDYYDVRLKQARLARLEGRPGFAFRKLDIADRDALADLFADERPSRIVHLAAQAGVRYGSINPHAYVDSNIVGFLNILEGARRRGIGHLVYASSSSVYGANARLPFSVHDAVDHPLSLYAATKKSNELMAHAYAHLYDIPVTGLRFFTVYGPWGRPDMAPFLFTRKVFAGEPIEVYNFGQHARDFTYIDDIAEGTIRVLDRAPSGDADWSGEHPDPATSAAPYRVYNIGNNSSVELMYFIECIEKAVGRTVEKIMLPMQPGDVPRSFADIDDLTLATGFKPSTSIETGIERFVAWYRDFYGVS